MPFRNEAIAALALLVMVASVAVGGHAVLRQQEAVVVDEVTAPSPVEPSTATIPEKRAEKVPVRSRAIDPEIVAPRQFDAGRLERIEPRAPLSNLSLAMPPKPPEPRASDAQNAADGPKGTTLFQSIASAAGVIETKDRSVTIAGIDMIAQDETCTDEHGRRWACGLRARGAFRAFLRGRAPVCTLPDPAEKSVVSPCSLGKQDIGTWLVSNGWARPAEDGPYVEVGEKAKAAMKGIFGEAPDLSGLPPAPAPVEAPPEGRTSILDLSGEAATPPIGQPAPFQ
ncbi:thermonuclease family protein [Mesorhizobium sp. A556]